MRQVLGAGALGRPRGMGWRGRQEGRSGWGTHVNPWLIHVNVWQKPVQYCKVISLQLIKINGEKNFKLKKKCASRIAGLARLLRNYETRVLWNYESQLNVWSGEEGFGLETVVFLV